MKPEIETQRRQAAIITGLIGLGWSVADAQQYTSDLCGGLVCLECGSIHVLKAGRAL